VLLSTQSINTVIFDSFNDIETTWRSFEEHSDNYAFQNFDWLKHWYGTIGLAADCKACLVVVEYPVGRPVMILPLGVEKRQGVGCLVWLGGAVSDYHAPLLSVDFSEHISTDFFQMAWSVVKTQLPAHDAIIFEKMPMVIGKQNNPFVVLPCIPTASNAHFTYLSKPLDSFLKAKRSSKSIATEKRKHRRLQEHGLVEFVTAQSPAQIDRFLANMIAQKARSYLEMGVENLFESKEVCDFFNIISAHTCSTGFVHLSALMIDDRIIATHWGLVYKKRFYHLYPTYELSELTKYAPGGLLMWHLFEWCIDNDVDIYDFTIGDEPYKDQWCDQELNLYDHYQGVTALGVCYAWIFKTACVLKRKIKQTPVLWEAAQVLRTYLSKIRH
jgi:CelD/BcsL family acetyltransferase involved in cellulose biosynthesis